MAKPTAPTEAGNLALDFSADSTATTPQVSNKAAIVRRAAGTNWNVGWEGVATHRIGDTSTTPGGFPTGDSNVPGVLGAALDGTTVRALQATSGGLLKIDALPTGTAAIGKLAANDGVDIGDVSVNNTVTVSATQLDIDSLNATDDIVTVTGGAGQTADVKVTLDSEAVVLGSGTAAIGKLGANSGVDIGDVDVTSMPGTAAESAALPSAFVVVAGDDGTDTHPLQQNTSGHLKVDIATDTVGIGGGTQYAVNDALGAAPTGTLALAKRDDALSSLSPIEADAVELRVDANGALWTHDDALDAAISGSELQVDVVASLPTGTNAIGKLAANSGVDIGDVDVTSMPGTAAESAALPSSFVVVAGDDGVDTHPLQQSSTGDLKITLDSETVSLGAGSAEIGTLGANNGIDIGDVTVNNAVGSGVYIRPGTGVNLDTSAVTISAALPTGTNAIGKLSANSGVDIGDVDVTSVTPGTASGNLGKAEDVAHTTGDTGVMSLAVRNDAGGALAGTTGDYIPLTTDSVGALRVTGGGGGTEYNEDVATPNPIVGTATLIERDDELTTVSPIEGDWIGLRGTAEGALWTQDFNSDTISTNTTTIAGAVSGTEMQVDVVASLPTGTNAIGKLAANSGVDIGDVDVTSVVPGTGAGDLGKAEDAIHATGDTGVMALAVRKDTPGNLSADGDYIPLTTDGDGRLYVNIADGGNTITVAGSVTATGTAGDAAHDAADTGSPVKIGGRGQTPTAAAELASTDNDRVDALFDLNGRLAVRGDFNPQHAVVNVSTGTDNTIVSAPGANKAIAVWAILLVSDGTTDVRWESAAGGTAHTGQIPLQAREGYAISAGGLVPLFVCNTNAVLNLERTISGVVVNGFVSYSVLDV